MEKFTNGLVSIQVLIIHWPRVLLWSNFLTNAKISYWSTISRYLVNWQNGEYESMLEKKMQLFSLCGISIYFSYSFIYWMISLWFITKALLAKEREKSRDDFWTIFPSEISATFVNLEIDCSINLTRCFRPLAVT